MNKIITGCIILAGSIAGKAGYDSVPKKVSTIKKKLIAYDPKSFGKEPEKSVIGIFNSVIGVPKYERGYEAIAVSHESEAPEGYKVIEDREYNLQASLFSSDIPSIDTQIVPRGTIEINAISAQQINDGSDVTVCIVDTGLDIDHPDIRHVGGSSHVPGLWSYDDDNGHGTHVAGTVAATGNKDGIIGVSQAKLYIAKVLGQNGSGMGSWIASGILSCVRNGAAVINLSLGSPGKRGPDPIIEDAIKYAIKNGLTVIAAAGNDSGFVNYPAAQDGVIAVSALDENNKMASFSSRGPEISIAAPGTNILSLKVGGGTTELSGTSMAAPHVSAVFAMAIAQGTTVEARKLKLPANHQGIGIVDALESVR